MILTIILVYSAFIVGGAVLWWHFLLAFFADFIILCLLIGDDQNT